MIGKDRAVQDRQRGLKGAEEPAWMQRRRLPAAMHEMGQGVA